MTWVPTVLGSLVFIQNTTLVMFPPCDFSEDAPRGREGLKLETQSLMCREVKGGGRTGPSRGFWV